MRRRRARLTVVVDSVACSVGRGEYEHVVLNVEGGEVGDGERSVGHRTCETRESERRRDEMTF